MKEILCPKCSSNQVTANKKGFSGKKAVAGALLAGGVGILAGTIGSNKVKITCLACGHIFNPGEDKQSVELRRKQEAEMGCTPYVIIFVVLLIIMLIVFI
jgi:hypothetical protein